MITQDKSVVVAISGGFDPLHPGHIKYIEDALTLSDKLIVILTRDDQLAKKDKQLGFPKNRKPMLYEVRKAVIEWGLKGRGIVVPNVDFDITSRRSINHYHNQCGGIDIFAKGGDTWDVNNLPEKKICDRLGIKIVFGVGGIDKPFSSSKL